MYKNYFKRFFDVLIAVFATIILFPLFVIVTLLILFTTGRPIFYIQKRPGLHEKLFNLIKFRTMNFKKDNEGQLLPPLNRITKIGRFLRMTSIDELPEMINVLKGDMSLVGPRPLLVKYLPFYSSDEKKRHLVKPGLTGLAQINGRNSISWPEKFKFDIWYIDHLSFGLDLKIMTVTIMKVLKREGINSDAGEIVAPFDEYIKSKGSNQLFLNL